MSVTNDQVAALYAAVFNRAPDQEGLNFWVGQDNFVAIAEGFVAHPVFEAEYGEKSNLEFVQSIYENVLNGQGDAEGIDFWVNLLDSGASKGEFLANFLDAALGYEGDDADALLRQQALENKVAVALYYTETMGEASNLSPDVDPSSIDVAQDPVYKQSQEILSTVTADEATVVAAKAQIDAFAPRDEGELVEALESYQDALDVQADALDAEQAAAKAADDAVLNSANKPGADESYAIDTVTSELKDEVAVLADAALLATNLFGSSSMQLNAATIALARQNFESNIDINQAKVDLLKSQNKAAVSLQEKIQAYDDFSQDVDVDVINLDAAAKTLGARNADDVTVTAPGLAGANDAATFLYTLSTTPDIKVSVINGKVVAVDDAGAELVVDPVADKMLNELEGVDAFKAAVKAVFDNIKAQENAEKAIGDATIAALKAAGYKVYDKADDTAKVVAWSNVKIEGGELVTTSTATPPVEFFVRTTLDPLTDAAALVDYPIFDTASANELFTVGSIVPTSGELDAGAALSNVDGFAGSVIGLAAWHSEWAVLDLSNAEKASQAFEEALEEYQEAADLLKALTAATADAEDAAEAVAEAIELFDDLGVNLVVADEFGVALGEVYNENSADQDPDLFVYATSLTEVDNLDGPEDVIYFGDKAAAFVLVDEDFNVATGQLGGDNNVLEIFAYQDGANTVLYVEKEAFAGNSNNAVSSNDDLVKITLTGVQADELQLSTDGFLGFIG